MINLASPIPLWPEVPRVEPDYEHIKDQRVYSVSNPSLVPFLLEPCVSPHAAVLIFPGGGYTRLAINHEGYDIAHWFNERGISAFVVKHRLNEYGFPAPLLDGLRAMRIVRKKAVEWGINPNRIGVVGFSAGGHLAASIAVRSGFALGADVLAEVDPRPDFAVLGYPVITLDGVDAHVGSRKALLGDSPNPTLVYENSLQHHVSSTVPPMFIFHGVGDQAVPVTNSLTFFTEIAKFNKQSELHIYQSSIHGVGMIQGQGSVSAWPAALQLWLTQNNFM